MAHRSALGPTSPAAIPMLTTGEWRDVQRALRAVQDIPCGQGERPGPLHRGLAQIGRFVPTFRRRLRHEHARDALSPHNRELRDFLCESARHGPAVDQLAVRLQGQGYTPAQIAALSLIAG